MYFQLSFFMCSVNGCAWKPSVHLLLSLAITCDAKKLHLLFVVFSILYNKLILNYYARSMKIFMIDQASDVHKWVE
jgi:hypothetical protein